MARGHTCDTAPCLLLCFCLGFCSVSKAEKKGKEESQGNCCVAWHIWLTYFPHHLLFSLIISFLTRYTKSLLFPCITDLVQQASRGRPTRSCSIVFLKKLIKFFCCTLQLDILAKLSVSSVVWLLDFCFLVSFVFFGFPALGICPAME